MNSEPPTKQSSTSHVAIWVTALMASPIAGSLSAAFSNIILQPFDVIRTKQQLSLEQATPYGGFWNTVKRIGKEEGLRGYWRGTGPTIWRVVPGSAMYFLLLEKITNLLRRSDGIADIRTPLPVHLSLLAGASARSAASVLFLPITVVKTRFEAMGISNPYSSTIGAMQTIARVEGVSSLYRGLVPTVLRDAPHSAFYYAMYNYTKEVLSPYRRPDSQIPVAVLNFVAGLISGLTATIISHPFDVIRTRLQTQFATRSPQGMMAIAAYMIQGEGWAAFTRGFAPRLLRRSLSPAFTWTFYEELMALFRR